MIGISGANACPVAPEDGTGDCPVERGMKAVDKNKELGYNLIN